MTPTSFVQALSAVKLPNVFNPYADICEVHDRSNAAAMRRRGLRTLLTAAQALGIDTLWMGRDLGYRGGRRTGLALTDEMQLMQFPSVYPGAENVDCGVHVAVMMCSARGARPFSDTQPCSTFRTATGNFSAA